MKTTLAFLLSLTTLQALADTLRVPQDFPTIPLALASAGPSDTVEVSAGLYPGFDIEEANCTIVGRPGVIITSRVTVYESGASLEGLKLLGGLTSFYGVTVDSCWFLGDRLSLSNTEGSSIILNSIFEQSALRVTYSDAVVYGSMFLACEEPIRLTDICQVQVIQGEFYGCGESWGSQCASVLYQSCYFGKSPLVVSGSDTLVRDCRIHGDVRMDAYECFGPSVTSRIESSVIFGRVELVPLEGFLYGLRGTRVYGSVVGDWEDLGGNRIVPLLVTQRRP